MPTSFAATDSRQVLVNFGNRYAIFGPELSLPQPLAFDPNRDSEILPRVADESEIAHERIVETLRVSGMKKSLAPHDESEGDIVLIDEEGNRTIVEIKVRTSDPKQRDLNQATELLKKSGYSGTNLEIWFFNIEKLKLIVMSMHRGSLDINTKLALDVWEKSTEGIFERSRVEAEVEGWVSRINTLYNTVQEWLRDEAGLRFERTRRVTMSEELMQLFAVTDRDLPLLDVFSGDQIIASFVPRGLWLIGAWGRIDVITNNVTTALVGIRNNPNDDETFEWRLPKDGNRRDLMPLTKEALLSIVRQQ